MRQEHAGADKADRQSRLAAPLHQKPGEVDRVDDIRGLKLVEAAPDEAGGAGSQIEPAGDDVHEQIGGADDRLARGFRRRGSSACRSAISPST